MHELLKPEGEDRQRHPKVFIRAAWGSGQNPSWMEPWVLSQLYLYQSWQFGIMAESVSGYWPKISKVTSSSKIYWYWDVSKTVIPHSRLHCKIIWRSFCFVLKVFPLPRSQKRRSSKDNTRVRLAPKFMSKISCTQLKLTRHKIVTKFPSKQKEGKWGLLRV